MSRKITVYDEIFTPAAMASLHGNGWTATEIGMAFGYDIEKVQRILVRMKEIYSTSPYIPWDEFDREWRRTYSSGRKGG